MEWDFLRFDPRYRAMQADERVAYLHLWATCVHLRRDRYSKDEIEGPMLADMAGVNPQSFCGMVGSAMASGLLSRGPGGVVTVEGVRAKHSSLRNWNDDGLRTLCGDALSEKGKERKGKESETKGSETSDSDSSFHSLLRRVRKQEITSASVNGTIFRVFPANDGMGFVLDACDGHSIPRRVMGQQSLDAVGDVTWT